MPKIWIDALTPKQALFTKAMIERAPSKAKCVVTTRDYSELNQFVKQINLPHIRVGRHGGGDLLEKLKASIERQNALTYFVSENDFDLSFSYISPEAARVSFGIKLKHFICSDSPHSNAPCRLAVPLSAEVFTPFAIKKERWTQYGIKQNQVFRYLAMDPWAWLLSLKAKRGRSEVCGRVVIRLEEALASYMREGKGISIALNKLVKGIKEIGDFEIVLVPRYDEQRAWAKKVYGNVCVVPDTTIDGVQIILKSDLLIGGGATMTQEAALLGVPSISYFPSAKLDVFENYYFPKKLSVKASNPSQLTSQTFKLLRNIDKEKERVSRKSAEETRNYVDPVKFVFDRVLRA